MAKEPIIASTTRIEQPNAAETRKDQKGFQLPEEYNARLVNQNFDQVHERINKIVTETLESGEVIEDLVTSGVVATDVTALIARVNLLSEILRDMGGLRRTK